MAITTECRGTSKTRDAGVARSSSWRRSVAPSSPHYCWRLDRAERCEDDEGCFIFLCVAFNATYADEAGQYRLPEATRLQAFLARLVELDGTGRLESVVWEKFPGPIRVLLGNKYVFQPWWDHLTGSPTAPTGKSASSVPTGPPVMRLPTATPARSSAWFLSASIP